MWYWVNVERYGKNDWVVTCPKLPGMVTGSFSRRRALRWAQDALMCMIDYYRCEGKRLPFRGRRERGQVRVNAKFTRGL